MFKFKVGDTVEVVSTGYNCWIKAGEQYKVSRLWEDRGRIYIRPNGAPGDDEVDYSMSFFKLVTLPAKVEEILQDLFNEYKDWPKDGNLYFEGRVDSYRSIFEKFGYTIKQEVIETLEKI